MVQQSDVLSELKESGYKITRARKALVEILLTSNQPLSVPEVTDLLKHSNISANKTTIYREITFLKDKGIVKELDLGESKKRYEFDLKDHHHHLVCLNCQNIEDFELKQDLDLQEKHIRKQKDFKVINHSLEFFGLCWRCH